MGAGERDTFLCNPAAHVVFPGYQSIVTSCSAPTFAPRARSGLPMPPTDGVKGKVCRVTTWRLVYYICIGVALFHIHTINKILAQIGYVVCTCLPTIITSILDQNSVTPSKSK